MIGKKITKDGFVEVRIGEIDKEKMYQDEDEEDVECDKAINKNESVSGTVNIVF